MKIASIGISLANNIFQLHGNDSQGTTLLHLTLGRYKVIEFFADLKPCLIGMEACGSANYWAKRFVILGHTVKLIAPSYLNFHDRMSLSHEHIAKTICDALTHPNTRFAPIKPEER